MAGMEDVVIAGGTEMMSSYKENASKARLPFMDRGNLHLRDLHPQTNQGVAADAIATLEGISRTALDRSEEHTSELQSLMRISYAVFCLKKKKQHTNYNYHTIHTHSPP